MLPGAKEIFPAPAFTNETARALNPAPAVGGIHMKSILAVTALLLLASNLHAQASRRAVMPSGSTNNGSPSLDFTDPYVFMFSHAAESNPPAASPHPGNAVSVGQLRIPSKAIKEFERSQKAFQSGDVHTSVEHLQKALRMYPDFIQAHNALGLRFIKLGEYQKALAEHQAALALDPRRVDTHQDISFALLLLNRNKEAEDEARQALDLDSQLVASRYLLGRALIARGRISSEGMEMLRQSEDAFPDASLVLAQIHFQLGHSDQVIAELRHYLKAPSDPDNKQKAECWVAQLSQQPLPAGCPAQATRPSFQ
jgi:tetratricopeptide (TPR) repeat protein